MKLRHLRYFLAVGEASNFTKAAAQLQVAQSALSRLTGTTESLSAGIARAKNGHVTPAGEEFCEILRKVSDGATATEPGPQGFS
jgi:DNA-binding transcriptional LysR family regulator